MSSNIDEYKNVLCTKDPLMHAILDDKCPPPQGLYVKGLAPRVVLLGGGNSFKR